MSIYMWWYPLPRHVVIHGKLIEGTIPLKECLDPLTLLAFFYLSHFLLLIECEFAKLVLNSYIFWLNILKMAYFKLWMLETRACHLTSLFCQHCLHRIQIHSHSVKLCD